MLSETRKIAKAIEKEMSEIYLQIGIEYNTYVSEINAEGVKVI